MLRMTSQQRFLLFALVALLACAPSLSASIAELATFDEKVENAATIVLGTCVRTSAHWDGAHRWIVTDSTFRVEKVLKGSTGVTELTIVTPGGSVGGLHQETIGVPRFQPGDERVLFVKMTRSGPTVLYFDQGTYDVRTEAGQKIIAPITSKLVKIDANGAAVTDNEPPRDLSRFEGDVQQSLRTIGDRKQRMGAVPPGKQLKEDSFTEVLKRNPLLVTLALAGLALATWRLVRKSD
jgi:hypothetical protein